MNRISLVTIAAIAMFWSCRKHDKTAPACGCDAPDRIVITNAQSLIGSIRYNTVAIQGFDSYKNKFFIVYVERDCSNCVHTMLVCNEDYLPQEFLRLKNNPNESIRVRFAGHLKFVCDGLVAPGDYTYEHINLTLLEKQ